jgi:hypothetical protein
VVLDAALRETLTGWGEQVSYCATVAWRGAAPAQELEAHEHAWTAAPR